jgi:3-hydroxyisobutyrate dehydrogenase-like beta-hydroxyacid dehydrogenase
MNDPVRVGFIGIGLMGHGMARNLAKDGFPLTFLDHPGNQPVDDLRSLGAESAGSAAAVTQCSDVVFICVTGSPQVRDVVFGAGGVLEGLGPGKTVVDCSTVEPATSRQVAAAVSERGAQFLDAPLTRTPKEAEAGRLNVMVGGDEEVLAPLRPLFDSFAENVYHAGATGAGHTLKLLHNYVSLGNCVLLAEAVVCARAGGVDSDTLLEVLASGGGGSTALQRLSPYILEGDDGNFRFSISNCRKDLTYYTAMANDFEVPAIAAQAIQQVFALANALAGDDRPVPRLIDLLAELHGGDGNG